MEPRDSGEGIQVWNPCVEPIYGIYLCLIMGCAKINALSPNRILATSVLCITSGNDVPVSSSLGMGPFSVRIALNLSGRTCVRLFWCCSGNPLPHGFKLCDLAVAVTSPRIQDVRVHRRKFHLYLGILCCVLALGTGRSTQLPFS